MKDCEEKRKLKWDESDINSIRIEIKSLCNICESAHYFTRTITFSQFNGSVDVIDAGIILRSLIMNLSLAKKECDGMKGSF